MWKEQSSGMIDALFPRRSNKCLLSCYWQKQGVLVSLLSHFTVYICDALRHSLVCTVYIIQLSAG